MMFIVSKLSLRFGFKRLIGYSVVISTFRTFIEVLYAQCGQSCGDTGSVHYEMILG